MYSSQQIVFILFYNLNNKCCTGN